MRQHGILSYGTIAVLAVLSIAAMPGGLCAAEKDRLVVTGFAGSEMKDGAPAGWELQRYKGTPNLSFGKEEDGAYVLHLKCDSMSSFGISKDIDIDIEKYPSISWKWKALKIPRGGDVRKRETDDQAIQLYIAFEPLGWPKKLNTPLLGYIWDSESPKGTIVTSSQPFASKVRYIVLRNKDDKLDTWHMESRNLVEDYKRVFPDIEGGALRKMAGVLIYINAHNTKSEAESFIGDVTLESKEIPPGK